MKNNENNRDKGKENYYKDISDPRSDSLVFRMQAGDPTAFPQLLERTVEILTRSTYRYFIKGYEREDLYQEACLVLIEAIDKYMPDKGLSFNQYVNLCLDNHFNRLIRFNNTQKRKSMFDSVSYEDLVEEHGYQFPGGANTFKPSEIPLVKESINDFLESLSLFEKEVYYFLCLGKSYEQISKIMDISKRRVMDARHRCARKYKEYFR